MENHEGKDRYRMFKEEMRGRKDTKARSGTKKVVNKKALHSGVLFYYNHIILCEPLCFSASLVPKLCAEGESVP